MEGWEGLGSRGYLCLDPPHTHPVPILPHPLNCNPFLTSHTSGSHKLEVKVGGDSMLARLLRKTIGALNSSSETVVESNNMRE